MSQLTIYDVNPDPNPDPKTGTCQTCKGTGREPLFDDAPCNSCYSNGKCPMCGLETQLGAGDIAICSDATCVWKGM